MENQLLQAAQVIPGLQYVLQDVPSSEYITGAIKPQPPPQTSGNFVPPCLPTVIRSTTKSDQDLTIKRLLEAEEAIASECKKLCIEMAPPRNGKADSKSQGKKAKKETEEEDVTSALSQMRIEISTLTLAILGNGKERVKGIADRLNTIEKDIYGDKEAEKGLKHRVKVLETKVLKGEVAAWGDAVSTSDYCTHDNELESLRATNAVLMGFTSRLQRSNKSLQNQLHVQQDKQNYLNLHLRGVAEMDDKSAQEQVAQFFREILELKSITEKDFVKVYRKSKPREYDEGIQDEAGHTMTLHVKAPGVMWVCLHSEILREHAMERACKLGGCRHPELNHKYFVNEVQCEAVQASKEKHHHEICDIQKKNRSGEEQTKYHFFGKDFYVNGEKVCDTFTTPSYDEICSAMLHEKTGLENIDFYKSDEVTCNRNVLTAFLLRTARIDVVCLAYIKAFILKPHAAHILLAYKNQ